MLRYACLIFPHLIFFAAAVVAPHTLMPLAFHTLLIRHRHAIDAYYAADATSLLPLDY